VGVDFLRLRSDTEPDEERKSGDPQESNQSTKQEIYNQPEFALLLLFVCFGGGASDLSAVEGVSFVCAQIRKLTAPRSLRWSRCGHIWTLLVQICPSKVFCGQFER
jgi:hypothetical protein